MNFCQTSQFNGVKSVHLLPKPCTKCEAVIKRREKFKERLRPYLPMYGKEILNAFYTYWTEFNKSKTKMRFELERTWELKLRLSRWDTMTKMNDKKTATPGNRFPDYFSKKFQDTLQGQDLSDYWKHLRSLELSPKKDLLGNTIDWIKQ